MLSSQKDLKIDFLLSSVLEYPRRREEEEEDEDEDEEEEEEEERRRREVSARAHRVRDAQVREQPQQVLDLLHLRHARLVHLLARVGAVNLTRDYVAVLLVRVLLRQRVRAPAAANAHLSQLFSYARPEPVLVNRSFFSIKKAG